MESWGGLGGEERICSKYIVLKNFNEQIKFKKDIKYINQTIPEIIYKV